MLKHYNTDENKEYVSISFETHDSVLVGSVNACIQTVFLGGVGMGQMAPHYVRLMSFLLAIFEGRVAVILMAGNWEVK